MTEGFRFCPQCAAPLALVTQAEDGGDKERLRCVACGDSPASMKPVISANILPDQAAFCASKILPSYSTTAASTGVGLFQWLKPQATQRRRSLSPPSSACVTSARGAAHCGQNLKPSVMKNPYCYTLD